MTYTPHIPPHFEATIELPSSKSLSNRALLLAALSGNGSKVERASTCDDTFVMQRALNERTDLIDVMAAGTAMRFLTAYFSTTEGEQHTLTGTERMRQRPIGVLVEALRKLGAEIEYTENEGFPPLRIKGHQLRGGELTLPANVSSQYISALLMVAPQMTEGLLLTLEGTIISRPYIHMTISLMRQFGAEVEWVSEKQIKVEAKPYKQNVAFAVESDWSAASYWYEILALSPNAETSVALPWLCEESLQGDSAIRTFFEPLGVATTFDEQTSQATLTKTKPTLQPNEVYELNLVNQPDLAQTLVVTCALLRQPFHFTGLQSLRIKETDRMAALQNELAKLGIALGVEDDEALYIYEYDEGSPRYNGTSIATYHDHRMAMAFAPACLLCPELQIANPEVVSKSYPSFWDDLKSLEK